ncbi:MAG TPA: ATP-binding protein [Thermoanaerobaculia bacterium]|nr:ATP-binding protein [Thermoanaerobaculia bacterium]
MRPSTPGPNGSPPGATKPTGDSTGEVAAARLAARLRDLARVHELSTAVARAGGLPEVYEIALDAVIDALAADRASLLLFDPAGVLRFCAWRGLSEEYRQAVEGHTPWGPDDVDATPIAVDDALADESLAALRPALEREGIRALAFVPLASEERLLGKFMVYRSRPHEWSSDELRLAHTLGNHVAFAVERARRDEALREHAARLAESDQHKDEFLALLGHELRNPVAAFNSGLALIESGTLDEADRRRVHQMMRQQTTQLTRLLDDLLDVTRIARGKVRLQKQRIDMAAVVEGAVESARPLIESHGHRLTTELGSRTLAVDGDAQRLEQVFVNLLANAVRYTDPGGSLAVEAVRRDGEVAVTVRDSGAGLSADDFERIFEPFTQLSEGAEGGGGLGLGLTLVRDLVALHGGRVSAASEGPGRGSAFEVVLPLAGEGAAGEEAASGEEASPVASPAGLEVLVVDDNRDAADSLSMLLEIKGCRVATAYDGVEALEMAARQRPAAVVLDIAMPGMNGYDVALRMRSDPQLAAVRIIALTGFGHDEARRRVRQAGIDEHLVKPVDLDHLMRLLGEVAAAAPPATRE